MATTEEVLVAARSLGKLVSTHEAARRFDQAIQKLQEDLEAQRLLNDLNRTAQRLAQKEAAGQPIEVQEKRELEGFQQKVVRNDVLRQFQTAQMDYLDLMRKVDEAIEGPAGEAVGAGAGPIARPG